MLPTFLVEETTIRESGTGTGKYRSLRLGLCGRHGLGQKAIGVLSAKVLLRHLPASLQSRRSSGREIPARQMGCKPLGQGRSKAVVRNLPVRPGITTTGEGRRCVSCQSGEPQSNAEQRTPTTLSAPRCNFASPSTLHEVFAQRWQPDRSVNLVFQT